MHNSKQPTLLTDYKPSNFKITNVKLLFQLDPNCTKVTSKLSITTLTKNTDLILDGKNLDLKYVKINGKKIKQNQLIVTSEKMTIPSNLIGWKHFFVETLVIVNPKNNSSLEGLYISSGIFCTQCEAEGFRKITYFIDRPDILATYNVRIEGPYTKLLSNGNLLKNGKNFAEWYDPWPKPSYLFALVAGNMTSLNSIFITKSKRKVKLKIFSKPGNTKKCKFAMTALKKAMRWDEEVYRREYDLDLFMIVAINDFNMGAMENKGLNIFNSKYIHASKDTATDDDYKFIERIVAHEYFHNWTGNRITCRDWFQLCLKEGLTVFRDQQFSADVRDKEVSRIEDVILLRLNQFREDDGPLSHPVRPSEYLEINNFYTATIYEKGAELIRMLKLLTGPRNYDLALDTFFETYDGCACTIDDLIKVFERVTGKSLKQFSLWYSKRGRPTVCVSEKFENDVYSLTFEQKLRNQKKATQDEPFVIPVLLGLLSDQGTEILNNKVITLKKLKQTYKFKNLSKKPIPSLFRGFSAPITLSFGATIKEYLVLLKHDSDLFNRWEAGQNLSKFAIERLIRIGEPISKELVQEFANIIKDDTLDPSFRSLFSAAPNEQIIMNQLKDQSCLINPDLVVEAQKKFNFELAKNVGKILYPLLQNLNIISSYQPNTEQSGKRNLKLKILNLISYLEPELESAIRNYYEANNMTEKIGSLKILIHHGKGNKQLHDFHLKWKDNDLVMDKWFSIQASQTVPELSLEVVKKLSALDEFEWKNPNRFRSLIGSFAVGNFAGFHKNDGEGYRFVADWLIKLDALNPQTAARLCTVFDNWQDFDSTRQKMMAQNLDRLLNSDNISLNTFEITQQIRNN